MTEKIKWSLQVRVTDGPQLVASGTEDVEAYDKISAEIPASGSQQVDLIPADTERIGMVVILPATPSDTLSYKVGNTTVTLDSPHAFLGTGAARLLGTKLSSLTFTNSAAEPALVEILVGRDVTP
ncbi:hypothetical protein [Nonomuraea sp. B5E05]|uniref:hypothetical protein n=1 Tax=Nonomuraea sp. B5E05 TaxID=3153569 RepID=UPI0032614231